MSEFRGELKCTVCGAVEREGSILISLHEDIYICSRCIELCQDKVRERDPRNCKNKHICLLKPHEINEKLNDYVIGQDLAKKVLSVAVYSHYKRIHADTGLDDVVLEKSNILMLGPTGSGKTLLARTLANVLNVPFAVADATTLTEAGYVGEDVENILLKLIKAANYDINEAQVGIIYIDEIDKIACKTENVSITRDVSGEGVQQALLKIIEGTVASVPPQGGRKHPQQDMLQIDTTNILFICGGAFVGLDKIVAKRKDSSTLGFGSYIESKKNKTYSDMLEDIQPDDMIKFGLIPEFIGRLPICVGLNELDEEALVSILTEPKNSLVKQYTSLLKMDNVELIIKKDAIRAVAQKAIKLNTGARGLRSILERVMLDVLYDVPQKGNISTVIIDADVIWGKKNPTIKTTENISA